MCTGHEKLIKRSLAVAAGVAAVWRETNRDAVQLNITSNTNWPKLTDITPVLPTATQNSPRYFDGYLEFYHRFTNYLLTQYYYIITLQCTMKKHKNLIYSLQGFSRNTNANTLLWPLGSNLNRRTGHHDQDVTPFLHALHDIPTWWR
jgi:hypothetical protein